MDDANERNLALSRELREKVTSLQAALDHVRTLEGLLPMCAWCKRMKEKDGSWVTVERYISAHTSAAFTHGICPECDARLK